MVDRKRVARFVGITYGASWLLLLGFYLGGVRWNTPGALVPGTLVMLVPAAVVFVLQRWVHGEPLKVPLGILFRPNRWFLVAWLLPPVMALCALGLSLLMPGIEYSTGMEGILNRLALTLPQDQISQMRRSMEDLPLNPFWLTLIQGLAAGGTVNALFAFGEELGWRGFLHREVKELGFYRSSLLIGVIWGVWHAPLILQGHNYPEHPVAGVFLMVLWCSLLSPLFTYIRAKSGSVIATAILHGSINGTVGISFMLIRGGNDLTTGLLGLPGMVVLLVANAGLYLYDRIGERRPLICGIGDRGL